MKKTQHHLIYIPGLHDTNSINRPFQKLVMQNWNKQGFYPHLFLPHWEDGKNFELKLKKIVKLIDQLTTQGHKVSLIGQSAGGSAALNAFFQRRKKIKGLVNITGRLRVGKNVRPSLDQAAKFSPAFKQSVLLAEKVQTKLTPSDLKRIMTIRPIFDQTVPSSTVPIKDAHNLVVPLIEHSLSGGLISYFYSKKFLDFLNSTAG